MPRILGLALFLAMTQWGWSEEIPASQIVKVSHQEGYTVLTETYEVSEAIVWRKGVKQQGMLLVVGHKKDPKRYFTISRTTPAILVGEGRGVKFTLDNEKSVLRIESGGKKSEEKFKKVIDS